MMSQTGSFAASGAFRSAGFAFTFTSAMLTYFGFMLQTVPYERNLRSKTDRSGFLCVPQIGRCVGQAHSYRVLPPDAKCWNRRGKYAIKAADGAERAQEEDH